MYTYKIKHAPSGLEETVVAGSVHYGTGGEWVKFYAESQANREYNPVYAIRADVVGSIHRMGNSKSVRLNEGFLIYKGDYNSQNIYCVNEVVRYGDGLYLALKTVPISTVSRNTAPTANNEYWATVVYKGNAFPEYMLPIVEQNSAPEEEIRTDKTKEVADKAKIAAQVEEIRRLQSELAAAQEGSTPAKEGSLVFMGDYDPDHIYYMNNLVKYQDGMYYALKTVPRNTAPTDTEYWAITKSVPWIWTSDPDA